jgi:hypothetical protein
MATFDDMKRLGFWSAPVFTEEKVGLEYKRSQTTEFQLFCIVCLSYETIFHF